MADKTISALDAATTPLAGTEVLPIVQSSTTKKVSVANLTVGRSITAANVTASSTTTNAGVFSNYNNTNIGRMVSSSNGNLYIGQQTGSGTVSIGTSSNADLIFLNGTVIGLGTTSTAEAVNFGGNAKLNTGNLVIGTAGKGVDFSANANAPGMTSELLTWYEEGAWTPVATAVSGTFTSVSASGRYVRVGKLVTVTINAYVVDVGTATGLAGFSGLPFTSENQNPQGSGVLRNSLDGKLWNALVSKNNTTCVTNRYDGTTAVVNNDQLVGSFSYFAA